MTFTNKNVVDIYTGYKILELYNVGKDLALGDSSFEAVKWTKNTDPDKYCILAMISDLMCVEFFRF